MAFGEPRFITKATKDDEEEGEPGPSFAGPCPQHLLRVPDGSRGPVGPFVSFVTNPGSPKAVTLC